MSRNEGVANIRRANAEDVGPILDLLAFYERPRSYFEPFYLSDPNYRPEHSWVADQDGRLVAHLRIFDRSIRVGGVGLRIAFAHSRRRQRDHRPRPARAWIRRTAPAGHAGRA